MYEKNVKSILYFTLFIVSWCKADDEREYILDQQYYESLGFSGPKPTFTKKLYVAYIDGISMDLENPISLDNCHSLDTVFEINANYGDYFPVINEKSLTLGSNCTLFFPRIFIKTNAFADKAFAGFITIKAVHNQYVFDATSVVLIPRSNTKDLKIIFEVDGTEYIILNYFYLKITFVLVLLITVLILILELKEIHDRFYKFKYRDLETEI